MSAEAVLAALRQAGAELWVEGNRLRVRAPKGRLAPELRRELEAHRSAIVELLRGDNPAAPAAAALPQDAHVPTASTEALADAREASEPIQALQPGDRVQTLVGPGVVKELLPPSAVLPAGAALIRHDEGDVAAWDVRALRHEDGRAAAPLPLWDRREEVAAPRPDLAEDTGLWAAVLAETRRINPDPGGRRSLYGLLHGLRCGGARLYRDGGRLRLDYRPLLREHGGVWAEEELRRDWLEPVAENLEAVLAVVAATTEADQAAERRATVSARQPALWEV